jgi:hypothetical protein
MHGNTGAWRKYKRIKEDKGRQAWMKYREYRRIKKYTGMKGHAGTCRDMQGNIGAWGKYREHRKINEDKGMQGRAGEYRGMKEIQGIQQN